MGGMHSDFHSVSVLQIVILNGFTYNRTDSDITENKALYFCAYSISSDIVEELLGKPSYVRGRMRFSPEQALRELPAILEDLLECEVAFEPVPAASPVDAIVTAGGQTFFLAISRSGTLGQVAQALEQLNKHAARFRQPLLVVPYMSSAGKAYCRDRAVSWVDLSGNARVKVPGWLVKATGFKNRFTSRPPQVSVFAPKGSRIVRQLLIDPERGYQQKDLVEITHLRQGWVSRLVRSLREAGYLQPDTRLVRVARPGELLHDWHERYDFEKHSLLRGHVSARSGPSLLRGISAHLRRSGIDHAATGLAGAWLLTHFADFRLVTLYVKRQPTNRELSEIRFRQTDRGSNLWLVSPNDEGVFAGSRPMDTVPCVHPVQNYLDLKGHPERAKDAAEELCTQRLSWSRHASTQHHRFVADGRAW